MSWTDDRVEILKTRWADGCSGAQIANELGGVTRSSVISKINRMGLSGRTKGFGTGKKRNRPRNVIPFRIAPLPIPYSTEHQCRLVELTNESCRFPLWGYDTPPSDKFYCGMPTADVVGMRPYCAHHSEIAYPMGRRPEAA